MDFEKMVIGNFRTKGKYFVYLMNYYMPVLLTICVTLDPRKKDEEYNENFTGDKRAEQYRTEKMCENIHKSPFAKTYRDFTKIILRELSKQTKQIYGDTEETQAAENVISIYRSIYEGIEQLPTEERIVIKILFSINHSDLVKKFLQFTNITGLKASAMEKLKNALSFEEFLYFEEWLKKGSDITG